MSNKFEKKWPKGVQNTPHEQNHKLTKAWIQNFRHLKK